MANCQDSINHAASSLRNGINSLFNSYETPDISSLYSSFAEINRVCKEISDCLVPMLNENIDFNETVSINYSKLLSSKVSELLSFPEHSESFKKELSDLSVSFSRIKDASVKINSDLVKQLSSLVFDGIRVDLDEVYVPGDVFCSTNPSPVSIERHQASERRLTLHKFVIHFLLPVLLALLPMIQNYFDAKASEEYQRQIISLLSKILSSEENPQGNCQVDDLEEFLKQLSELSSADFE